MDTDGNILRLTQALFDARARIRLKRSGLDFFNDLSPVARRWHSYFYDIATEVVHDEEKEAHSSRCEGGEVYVKPAKSPPPRIQHISKFDLMVIVYGVVLYAWFIGYVLG
jgi:hypothetical protein